MDNVRLVLGVQRRAEAVELLERALGEPFDPAYYVRYLTEKYTKLYSL